MIYLNAKKNLATVPRGEIYIGRSVTQSDVARKYQPQKLGLSHSFRLQYEAWISETSFCSLMDDIIGNLHFQNIVKMGRPCLPFIFDKLRCEHSFIFLAANEILGGAPFDAPQNLDFDQMVDSWLEWAKNADNNYFGYQ